jgi:CheY-like chemotaxis protein
MKKVLIIEDDYEPLEDSFNYVNDIYFNNELDFRVVGKSQDIGAFGNITNYDYVFVDIKLDPESQHDGYGILKKIESENHPVKKVIILTANNRISEMLPTRGVTKTYPVVTKPIDIDELIKVFNEN